MIGIKQLLKKIMNIMNAYGEVGAIYICANNVNPGTIFGGKWTKLEGRFLLGSSSSYPVNSTGGSSTATISLPNHYHQVQVHLQQLLLLFLNLHLRFFQELIYNLLQF